MWGGRPRPPRSAVLSPPAPNSTHVGGWPTQARFWLEWGSSTAGQRRPATRNFRLWSRSRLASQNRATIKSGGELFTLPAAFLPPSVASGCGRCASGSWGPSTSASPAPPGPRTASPSACVDGSSATPRAGGAPFSLREPNHRGCATRLLSNSPQKTKSCVLPGRPGPNSQV